MSHITRFHVVENGQNSNRYLDAFNASSPKFVEDEYFSKKMMIAILPILNFSIASKSSFKMCSPILTSLLSLKVITYFVIFQGIIWIISKIIKVSSPLKLRKTLYSGWGWELVEEDDETVWMLVLAILWFII